ncbi:hypothetical protein [Mesorhizobium sp.]|uniref:hypothetical protein n=1 Tax=Mesorhizobium sp. TaxID=1871066 RepID=UPI00257EDEB5|nr:hypothetical protein [Mesorhizobium sp.]
MFLRQFLHGHPVGVSYPFGCHNEALRIEDEAAFIRFMLAKVPPVPPEAAVLRAANSGLVAAAA